MRKSMFVVFSMVIAFSMLFAACAPAATPAPAAPAAPAAPTAPAAATIDTSALAAPTTAAAAPAAPADTATAAPAAPAATAAPVEPTATAAPTPTAVPVDAAVAGKTQIYWYIGLGAGSQPAQIPVEKAFVKKYNETNKDNIQLIDVIVDNKYARDNLTTQLAAGNSVDIVGPVGTQGRADFPGVWLDLAPLVKSTNYSTADIDPNFLTFYKVNGALEGLPFGIYPSAIYVNKSLFKEAKLNLPPQKFGDPYVWADGTKEPWTFDTMAKVAKKLTVDKNGVDATDPKFDAKNIVQYGLNWQWTRDDARQLGTFFGAGYPQDAKGTTVIPTQWITGWKYFYDGMWGKQPFIPDRTAVNSATFGNSNTFNSGKIAMAITHTWYASNIDGKAVTDWDLAVLPTNDGKVTANMHADTFAILAKSKHPNEAFKVYTYMLGDGAPELLKLYGAVPARKSLQANYFNSLNTQFASNKTKVDWQVFIDSIKYMDVPNHQVYIPNNSKANDAFSALSTTLQTTPGLDIDKTIADFTTTLDGIFKAAK